MIETSNHRTSGWFESRPISATWRVAASVQRSGMTDIDEEAGHRAAIPLGMQPLAVALRAILNELMARRYQTLS